MSAPGRETLANVRLHPFVIVIGTAATSVGCRELWRVYPGPAVTALLYRSGIGVAAIGGLMLVFSYGAMARARATINPRLHTRQIVTTGIFRFSRNPIYLGWFLMLLGGGVANTSPFQVLLALLMIALLHWAVVLREEEYLENRFGDQYRRYKGEVRRWL